MKYKLQQDSEFKRFVPPLSSEEFTLLEQNILREGCRDAIVIWNGIILDGHNRYRICLKHNLPFQIKNLHLNSRDEAISWICANQMGRRNITEETRRYLIGKRYEAEKRIGARNITGKNQYSPKEDSPQYAGKASIYESKYGVASRLGKEYNVNHATVERYGRYARAVDRIGQHNPAAVPQLLSGAVQIAQENMIDLGKLSDNQLYAVASAIPKDRECHINRDSIIDVLKRDHHQSHETSSQDPPIIHTPSIKDMPAYDPDAEVASLTLTIPSWRSSMERVRSSSNMQSVSTSAKTYLRQELTSLKSTIDDLFSSIQEG